MLCLSPVGCSMPVSNTHSNRGETVLRLDRFSFRYPGAVDTTLRDISLQIGPGECHVVVGSTGSGKSTLLKAIRGLLSSGTRSGTIAIAGGEAALVLQNPKTQLLCPSLGADIAFGLENHCVEPSEMTGRVHESLVRVGLNRPLAYPVDGLSMGQQYRACIAGQLVMDAPLLMLDEPVAQLDARGREKVITIIHQFKSTGGAVLICEHRAELLAEIADHWWRLDRKGYLTRQRVPLMDGTPSLGKTVASPTQTAASSLAVGNGTEVLRLEGVCFAHGYGELDLSALSLSVNTGECVVISGPNGSGKTTLLRAIAGLVKPIAGRIEITGKSASLQTVRGRVALLCQEPGKQLFETTVFAEVAFAARRGGLAEEDKITGRVWMLLKKLGLEGLAEASPHTLSYGQKHLVGLAAVLAGRPRLLLLDDPFAGLDDERSATVMQVVAKIARQEGMTVLWTTHELGELLHWADKIVDLSEEQGGDGTGKQRRTVPSETDAWASPQWRRQNVPAGPMLIGTILLSMFAFGARNIGLLLGLTGVNLLLLLFFSREPGRVIYRSFLLFFWQGGVIVLLYVFRFGWEQGLFDGGRVAWQLFLAFWPGMIFMSSCTQPSIVRAIGRVLPQKAAFVSATCLRYMPMLISEMQQIREVQTLRGAHLLVSDLKKPGNWSDWLRCLVIPTLVKTLALADEIGTAAAARDFGKYPYRTNWPGE